MKKFYNNNDKYGEAGPFEADSKEQLADEMMPTFREWAKQAAVRGEEFMAGLAEIADENNRV